MSNVTFSGPIRVGTVRDGAVTAKNTGTPLLVQTAVVPFSAMTTSPTAQNLFTLQQALRLLTSRSRLSPLSLAVRFLLLQSLSARRVRPTPS